MKNFKVILTAILLVIIAQTKAHSQFRPKTLNVSFVSESITVPFGQFSFVPVHPGISIGTDLIIKDQTSWYRSLGIEAGYFYHRTFEHPKWSFL